MGLILRASETVARRLAEGIRRLEGTPSGRHGSNPAAQYTPQPGVEIAFVLSEEIPEEHGPEDEYGALERPWDPTQHGGKGAYMTSATAIAVRDTREVGYYGAIGKKGMCRLRFTSTGSRFGEIIDMECP